MAVGVDEAGHHGAPARIDALGAGRHVARCRADGGEAAVAHDHAAALDHVACAVENSRVADDEVLGAGRRCERGDAEQCQRQ
jgi:hypothetical protein